MNRGLQRDPVNLPVSGTECNLGWVLVSGADTLYVCVWGEYHDHREIIAYVCVCA